jgi:hypothetical protein
MLTLLMSIQLLRGLVGTWLMRAWFSAEGFRTRK